MLSWQQGYRDDGDMGLLYIGARWYDPAVGRWTSADKWLGNIDHPLSLNRYLYCEDEPVNAVDPSGRGWFEGIGVVLVAIGIIIGLENPPLGACIAFVGTLMWGSEDIGDLLETVPPPPYPPPVVTFPLAGEGMI